jgi:hypothetical protein
LTSPAAAQIKQRIDKEDDLLRVTYEVDGRGAPRVQRHAGSPLKVVSPKARQS